MRYFIALIKFYLINNKYGLRKQRKCIKSLLESLDSNEKNTSSSKR